MLLSGQISTVFFTTSGSFNAKNFGDKAQLLQWYAVNTGGSDVTFFNGQYTLSPGQSSPVFALTTGSQDKGTYFFTFDIKGNNGLLIVASIINE